MKIDDVIHKSIIMELTIKDNIVNNLKSLPFDILSRLTKFKIDCDTDGCDYEQLGTLENVIGKMTNLKLLKLLYSGGGIRCRQFVFEVLSINIEGVIYKLRYWIFW